MAYDFEAIRRDYPLASIVGRSIKLRRAGANMSGCCPFHADRSPSFVLYPDHTYHCFGCGVSGDVIDYVRTREHLDTGEAIAFLTGGNAPVLTDADRAALKLEQDQADQRRKANEANAIQSARARWAKALPVNGVGNGYLERKNVAPYGCRREGEALLVPIYDAVGLIQSVQAIPAEAGEKKLFHAGAPVKGGRMILSGPTDLGKSPIVIGEGFATCATVQAATEWTVVVAFSKGNIETVARDVRAKYPNREIVIAADIDAADVCAGIADAVGGRMVSPFLAGDDGSDFNDLAQIYGLDGVRASFAPLAPPEDDDRPVRASPFVWRLEAEIPRRQWLYGRHLLRKFVSVDVAAGGVGKSSLKIGEALALASGRDIYGQTLHEGALRVWLYNLEDPHEEIERRIHATAKRFSIAPADLGDRLFVDSGRAQRCVIAEETPNGAKIIRPIVDSIIHELITHGIDVFSIDPFVSSHTVNENDNGAIDMVSKEWGFVAEKANCAVNLVHHVRKQNGEAANADSARGASALVSTARSVMVYNRMTKDEAATLGVAEEELKYFFRVDSDKANLAPPTATTWYRMNNVDLDNLDQVGVACRWTPPDLFAGITTAMLMAVQKVVGSSEWRESPQASAWVGRAVAQALKMDADDKRDRRKITVLIKEWIKNGVLEIVTMNDDQRRPRNHIVVGNWVTE